jgi:hypothetical protein
MTAIVLKRPAQLADRMRQWFIGYCVLAPDFFEQFIAGDRFIGPSVHRG